ncbi:hypothetical protein [Bacteroides sp.]
MKLYSVPYDLCIFSVLYGTEKIRSGYGEGTARVGQMPGISI